MTKKDKVPNSDRAGLLEGKVAIIAGVGRGLGGDTAKLFAKEGARVVVMARSANFIGEIAAEAQRDGGICHPLVGDILEEASCRRVVAATVEMFGVVDVLVNVAAKGDGDRRIPLAEIDEDFSFWRESYEFNVIGPMRMARAVMPHMIARKSGRIIMVNSMTGEAVRPYSYAYSASKAALQKMTQVLALEMAPHGVRVNGLHPGFMWGPVVEEMMVRESAAAGISQDDWKTKVASAIPLGYIPPTSEYAGALLFMASDLSLPMTGASIHVNGGQYLR